MPLSYYCPATSLLLSVSRHCNNMISNNQFISSNNNGQNFTKPIKVPTLQSAVYSS